MATITTKETRMFDWRNRGVLKVGDEITETLEDGREVVFVVMDYGVIGLKGLLGWHQMNKTWTNKGGWLASDMRRYLNEEVIELLPDDLLAAIKPRKFGDEEDRLWLFSEVEIFGEHIWGAGDEGDKQLKYFKNPINRVKFDEDGDAYWWWVRSPDASNSSHFCVVDDSGGTYYSNANGSSGVCFGFYIESAIHESAGPCAPRRKENTLMELKDLREARNLSRAELSKVSGIRYQKIRDIEVGIIKPENITLKTAIKLAQALECDPAELMKPDREVSAE